MMKKILVTMVAFVLIIGAQAQTEIIDTSKFICEYAGRGWTVCYAVTNAMQKTPPII